MNATPTLKMRITVKTKNETVRGQCLPVLDVQLLYEDTETGLRARRAVARVQEQLDVNCKLALWRFDLLREGALREIVGREMEAADLLVVSFHGANSLRGAVCDYLEKWMDRQRDTPRALVLSQDIQIAGHSGADELVDHLQARAELRAIDLFHHFEPAPVAAVAAPGWEKRWLPDAAFAGKGSDQPRTERSLRYWGINE